MSRNFMTFRGAPYIGAPYNAPINLCNTPGKIVPLFIQWESYGASSANPRVGVTVNIQGNTPNAIALLNRIASVYIDNTNSNVPVYVYFPDTRFTAVAAPNTAGWYPVFTNQFQCIILGDGFVTGQLPECNVFLCDIFIPPYSDNELLQTLPLYKASPQITQGTTIYNQNFAVPALGDQIAQATIPLSAGISQAIILQSVPGGGFFYITGMTVTVFGLLSSLGGAPIQENIEFRNSLGQNIASFSTFALGQYGQAETLYNQSGMNLKLDANLTYSIRNSLNLNSGAAQMTLMYSYSLIP